MLGKALKEHFIPSKYPPISSYLKEIFISEALKWVSYKIDSYYNYDDDIDAWLSYLVA